MIKFNKPHWNLKEDNSRLNEKTINCKTGTYPRKIPFLHKHLILKNASVY